MNNPHVKLQRLDLHKDRGARVSLYHNMRHGVSRMPIIYLSNLFIRRLNLFNTADGMTTFQMPTSVFDPQHAIIPKSSGNSYVSYGGYWNGNKTNNVVMLNPDASTVLRSATIPLSWPRHLAIDTTNQHLFVADYCHQRVSAKLLLHLIVHSWILVSKTHDSNPTLIYVLF